MRYFKKRTEKRRLCRRRSTLPSSWTATAAGQPKRACPARPDMRRAARSSAALPPIAGTSASATSRSTPSPPRTGSDRRRRLAPSWGFSIDIRIALEKMERDRIKLKFLGDLSRLSPELLALIDRTNAVSEQYEGFQANICLNYGGRDEIVHAARAFARACLAGKKTPTASPRRILAITSTPPESRPGSHHSPQRRGADFKFSVMAVGLCGILFYRRPLAGLYPRGT